MSSPDPTAEGPLPGDFSDPALIALLTRWLEEAGAREIEITGADGRCLKITLGAGEAARPAAALPTPAASDKVRVKAPAAGLFRAVHPGAAEGAPALRAGQRVERGATVAFVQIGPVLLPVVAEEALVAGEFHVRAGDLVGYGDAILTGEPVR